VLSVAKLAPGQEAYYERSVAAGLDDYYAGEGESPGVWAGRGAAELELDGVVAEGQLGRLIGGCDPLTSAVLRSHPPRRQITVERIDVASGERRLERKTLAPVAGFDLVFSVPKSVSVLHALGDEETRLAITQAHLAAWQAALSYLEEEACVVRRGKNGVTRERGGGFVAAAYQHRTSRTQDPHLHTHVIVANMARSPSDGEWRALDGEAVLKTYRLAAGYLYEAQLRYELSRSLGVEWATPEKGWAELADVPRELIDAFSRRRAQVIERMADGGASGFYAAKVAAVATRERKESVDLPRLREEWRVRAAEHGLDRRALERLLDRVPNRQPTPAELLTTAERLLGPEGLTATRTTFSDPDMAMAWAEAHGQGAPVERIRALSRRLLATEGVRRLGEPAVGRPASYSTPELLAVEEGSLELVDRGRGAGAPAVPPRVVEQTVQRKPGRGSLSAEQDAMLRAVASSRDRVVCVVGLAGAGKTTATHAVADAFRAAGIPVVGAAPTGIAAERLQDETGIPSRTLHRLLAEAAREGGLPDGCALVVDEAGMAETRVLARVLSLVERAGGKAVLIGDPRQLPAVGAGGLFAAIVERHGAVKLTENHRQRDEVERRALEQLRQGSGRDYVAFAELRERIVVSGDPVESRARLLADWWLHSRDDLPANAMLAHRRADVDELNQLARTLMKAEARLGTRRLVVAEREFRAGDRIVCRRNSEALGVRNGTRGTVTSVEPTGGTLTIRTDRGQRLRLSRRYLEAGHVEHGYALTGHAGQGGTVERAFVLGGNRGALQEWGYVTLSRARQETRIYLTEVEVEPDSHFHQLDDRSPRTRLAQALEGTAAEQLASDPRPRPDRSRSRPVLARRPSGDPEHERSRTRLRILVEQQRATEELRARAEQRLAQATEQLSGLGLRARRRNGPVLIAEIAFQRSAIAAADKKLARLEPERKRALARVTLTETKAPTPDRHPGRHIGVSRQQFGPDLGR
jgi:conjugative relaxase-like TrwC/TraI family protein